MKRKSKFSLPSKYILLILTLLCVAMIFLSYNTDFSSGPFRTVAGYVFVPIQKGINNVGTWFFDRTSDFRELKNVLDENDELKNKIDELNTENSVLQAEHYEYERLLKLYDLDETYSDYKKIAARVIGKDPGNWFSVFLIDRGSDDGLAVDMNVISGGGLVGIITEVGPNWATVRSVIDDSRNISAMDLETSDTCMATGDLLSMNESQSLPFIQMNDSDSNAAKGDRLVTSQISDKYLPGLLIGYITSVQDDANGLTKSGTFTPVVDFEHIQEVLVILELK